MCGIAGYTLKQTTALTPECIHRMTNIFAHRGPDDEGFMFFNPETQMSLDFITEDSARDIHGIPYINMKQPIVHKTAFGHRRFSIFDISSAGHQPYWSSNQDVCLSFNGEIYNFVEIRQELEDLGHEFTTNCDTEVILEAYLEWGTACFKRFNGFWALSLYDTRTHKVLFSRDRIGQAPLYYCVLTEGVYWSSEIKSLLAIIDSQPDINEDAVSDFIVSGLRDVHNETFYRDIKTFPRASFAWVSANGIDELENYWELPIERQNSSDISISTTTETLHHLLTDAIDLRMRADVPVAFELSGGIDSSLLVSLTASRDVSLQAYTISFPNIPEDETFYARTLAEKYPDFITHHLIEPTKTQIIDHIEDFIWQQSEPFHSPNLITSNKLRGQIAAQNIRVVIGGAAADEIFAGYSGDYFGIYLRYLFNQGHYGHAFHEYISHSEHKSPRDYIRTLIQALPSNLRHKYKIMRRLSDEINPLTEQINHLYIPSDKFSQRMLDNMGDWRMNYWMRSGHQSSMSIPIEGRSPYLDYRVVEYAFSLPPEYLIRDGWMKWILRHLGNDVLPPTVVWRKKKQGFPFPISDWLAENKSLLFRMFDTQSCPYIDVNRLKENYDEIRGFNPTYLWRLIILLLWWKRIVMSESLSD